MESTPESETIEWDISISEVKQNGEIRDIMDFTKLSIGTEIRSKIWEQEHRNMVEDTKTYTEDLNRLTAIANKSTRGRNSRFNDVLHHGRSNNFRRGTHHYEHGHVTPSNSMESLNFMQGDFICNHSTVSSALSAYSPSFHPKLSEQNSGASSQSDITNTRLCAEKEFGLEYNQPGMVDLNVQLLQKENQGLKDEISHLKCLVEELNENRCTAVDERGTDGELPEAMRITLETVRFENSLREKEDECRELFKKTLNLEAEIKKLKSTVEHNSEKHRLEKKALSDKLEQKTKDKETENEKNKNNRKEDKSHNNNDEHRSLREKVKQLTEEKKELNHRLEEINTEFVHKESILKIDLHKHEVELQQYKDTVNHYQSTDKTRKADFDRLITTARETLEKERQDKYLLLVEQNKLKHKIEKMTETCKGLQLKNDELSRTQSDMEQEVADYRKIKQMIHEHGLPNHEQLIILQQQAESLKEDILSERKDRERAQAQREKMRRDLESAQSRISSLQEQVHKYQEHIMQLNGEKHRSIGNSTKLQRQLSSPSFVNHRIINSFEKPLKHPPIGPMPTSPQGRQPGGPSGFDDNVGRNRGFRPMYNNQGGPPRNFNDGRRGSTGGSGQFDNWQRLGNGNGQQRFHGSFNGMQNKPRSPLLPSAGEHWQSPRSPHPRQPFNQFSSSISYGNGIWSQQQQGNGPIGNPSGPCSPSGFNGVPNSTVNPWLFLTDSSVDTPVASLPQRTQGLKPFASESWSTGPTDDMPITSKSPDASEGNQEDGSARNEEFMCKKCEAKFNAADALRSHLEKCFG